MHSDQTRKDGSSESMIQALYYDFVANYVKTRMYSTRYVQCNSGGQSSADRGATESGTECEETGHLLPSPYIIIGAVLTDATLQMQGYYIMSHEILYNSMILTVHTNWEYIHYNTLMITI